MKKLIVLLLILLSSVSFVCADDESYSDRSGIAYGVNIIGNYIRSNDYAVGAGLSLGYRIGGMEYSVYGNWEWVFNPGGGPKALAMEFLVEPGFRMQWEIYRYKNFSAAFSMDIGCLMSIGENPSNGRFGLYGGYGAILRPMFMATCTLGNYSMGIGIYYQMMVYPRTLSEEFDGVGVAFKVL